MNKQIIVVVRDRLMDAFARPFFAPTQGAAIRSFMDELNRNAPDNVMYHHAGDYDLYELGTYDDQTGKIEMTGPKQIAVGEQLSTLRPETVTPVSYEKGFRNAP